MVASQIRDPIHSTDSVDDHILSFFADLVCELGGNPEELVREVSPDGTGLGGKSGDTTYRAMVRLVTLASIRLACADFGLRLAKRQAGHIRSPLVALMQGCATVGEALHEASRRSHAHSPAAAIWLKDVDECDGVLVGHDILLDGLRSKEQAMEQIMLIAELSIREIAGGHIRPREVRFRHQPLSPPRTYRRYFGCAVVFGQRHDALLFDRRDLALPTMHPDRAAFEEAAARIDHGGYPPSPWSVRVRGAISDSLGTDRCTNVDVARALDLHVRTLHRQLAAEGTTFQRIKTEVRRDLAAYYLEQTRLELSRISRRLGFAEQSGLVHFCRKWLLASPSEIRRGAREASGIFAGAVQNQQV